MWPSDVWMPWGCAKPLGPSLGVPASVCWELSSVPPSLTFLGQVTGFPASLPQSSVALKAWVGQGRTLIPWSPILFSKVSSGNKTHRALMSPCNLWGHLVSKRNDQGVVCFSVRVAEPSPRLASVFLELMGHASVLPWCCVLGSPHLLTSLGNRVDLKARGCRRRCGQTLGVGQFGPFTFEYLEKCTVCIVQQLEGALTLTFTKS